MRRVGHGQTPGSPGWTLRRVLRRPSAAVGLLVLLAVIACALAAPWVAPQHPTRGRIDRRLQPPGIAEAHRINLLGTDPLGRDVLSRIIFGARVSLIVGISAVFGAGVLGTVLGLVSGYAGRITDTVVMRVADVQLAFPFVLLALAIVAILGPGVGNLIIVFVVTGWVVFARIVRGQVLQIREREFVQASRGLGASDARVVVRHVLPNVTGPLIVVASFELAKVIIWEASLSFLGLGVPPTIPSWGAMLSDGRQYVDTAWWVATFPGVALMVVVLSINAVGDALRDALDPRLQHL
ncbi:MAG: ABC transporter permease [Armatimonadetes bacterium]|nr:ABC transporter permease [Armatimonadota bacterium]